MFAVLVSHTVFLLAINISFIGYEEYDVTKSSSKQTAQTI
jgi:hypothetical protein